MVVRNVDVDDQGAGPSVNRTLEYPVNDAERLEARVADMERDVVETEKSFRLSDALDVAVEAPLAPSAATPNRLEVPPVSDFSDIGSDARVRYRWDASGRARRFVAAVSSWEPKIEALRYHED